jgi:hypothetical protein
MRPANINIAAWKDHPDRFIARNLLDNYSRVTLDQVKSQRDRILALVAHLNAAPGPNTATGLTLAAKQHRAWLSTMISDYCIGDALSNLETFQI